MEQNKQTIDNHKEEIKQPKTWDQAITELKSFIIKSKQEEAIKQAEADHKE